MNLTDATQEIKSRWREFYPADGKGNGKGIICPLCGSGSGPNGTGISEKHGSRNHFLKCWGAGGSCAFHEGGSVIDLYMIEHGMDKQSKADFVRAVKEMADIIGIVIDEPYTIKGESPQAMVEAVKAELRRSRNERAGNPSFIGESSATTSAAAADPAQPSATKPAAPIGWDDMITSDSPGPKEPATSAADPSQQGPTSAADEPAQPAQNNPEPAPQPQAEKEPAEAPADDPTAKPARNFRYYYVTAANRLQNSPEAQAYLQRRGIGMAGATVYALGYDPAWISPTVVERLEAEGNKWRPAGTPRIIVPSGNSHYMARDIRPDDQISEAQRKYKKMNEGSPEIFGLYVAKNSGAENIFIVEGAFDALSVFETGQLAIALNSTNNVDKLLKNLEAEPIAATFIICLDNDEAGRKASAKLQDGLRRLNISCVEANISGGHNDPNDYLVADRAGFEAAIQQAIAATAARPDSAINYIENGGLVADIERRRAIGKKPTGFSNLDEKIGGGLRPGLYLLGAISSLGKTTFCSQLADGVAAAGNDVIYFSLEQSRLEMISKCLARETAKIDMSRAVTGGQIMDGYRADIITEAARNYTAAVGDRISIIEAGMNTDAQFVADYVRNYHKRTGARPVVIVDYLQALRPEVLPNGRTQDTREAVEANLRQLVLLKRELDLTIIAIVSLNRNNYLQPFDFEAIKETGLAEYSADAVWGLQLQCLDDPIFSSNDTKLKEKRDAVRAAKAAIPRKVRLCSVKHRGQQAVYECNFDYFPQYDLFIPSADTETKQQPTKQKAGRKL